MLCVQDNQLDVGRFSGAIIYVCTHRSVMFINMFFVATLLTSSALNCRIYFCLVVPSLIRALLMTLILYIFSLFQSGSTQTQNKTSGIVVILFSFETFLQMLVIFLTLDRSSIEKKKYLSVLSLTVSFRCTNTHNI